MQVLDSLGNLTTILSRLRNIGLFEGDSFPWAVYLYDLDVITDILEYSSLFIHYVEQRMETQKSELLAHNFEIQLFSLYLLNANLQPFGWKNENNVMSLLLTVDSFDKFDLYYNRQGPKPELVLDSKTRRKIQKLEKNAKHGFTEEINSILNKRIESSPFRG